MEQRGSGFHLKQFLEYVKLFLLQWKNWILSGMTIIGKFYHKWILMDDHLGDNIVQAMNWIGSSIFEGWDLLKDTVKRCYVFLKSRHGHRIGRFGKRNFRKARTIWLNWKKRFSPPFVTVAAAFRYVKQTVSDSKGRPIKDRAAYIVKNLWQAVRRNSQVWKTILNYAMPVAGIALFIFTVQFAGSRTFAVQVTYNDQELGYVANESVANAAKEIVQSRMVYEDENESVRIQPTYAIQMVEHEDMMTEYQLADAIIQNSGDEMVEAEGLYIDGTFYGAVEEEGAIQSALDSILDQYKQQEGVETAEFVNDVQIVDGIYLTQNIEDTQNIVDLLNSETQAESYYTVVDGDTPIGVAQKNNISYSDLKALNPNIEEVSFFQAGAQVLLTHAEAFLPVQITKTEVYAEAIPYQTEVTESSKYAKGTKQVEQKGQNGESQVTAKVTYVNGQEVSREILSSEVTKQPVTEKITEGTADFSVVSISGNASSSGFINPLPGCYLSSGYGSRWGTTHGGVDLCVRGGTYGKPIYAAAGGTVTFAGRSGAYGNLVKIRHSNGVETWYAHTSSIAVSSGQVVAQGQLIAYAGATGQVTGPHLHFEVRVNGIRKNPLNYINVG